MDKIIEHYLNKNYHVSKNLVFDRTDHQIWCCNIASEISVIFSRHILDVKDILVAWLNENNLNEEKIHIAWKPIKLKISWSPAMSQDLTRYGVSEINVLNILKEEIYKEIQEDILLSLPNIGAEELFSVIKCIGYEITEAIYDPNTFTPKKFFISIPYHQMIHERNNNTIWQDWIRTRQSN